MHKFKLLFFFIVGLTTLFAQNKPDAPTVQILADSIEQNGSLITAQKDVLIFSPSYYITAQKVVFDRNKSTIELFDKVSILKKGDKTLVSNYAYLNLENEVNRVSPILLVDKKSNIWINAKDVEKNKTFHTINDATISSCEFDNPAWSIGFSHGDYNTSSEWINTYNNTLYIKGIPAWYFLLPAIPYTSAPNLLLAFAVTKSPYFGFPTNTDRRSGLLVPKIGYSNNEGWFYMQPFYYAPQENFDFEYTPQYRKERGYGHELRFRLADSPYSSLLIESGIFYEFDKYFNKNNLINNKHYGWNLQYQRDKLFSKNNSSDGLYLKAHSMNDVDYLTTSYYFKNNSSSDNSIDKLLKSEVKYFFDTQYYHFNFGFDNYNDISKSNNDDVMQVQPYSNLHQYSQEVFFDGLEFSSTLSQENNTRELGVGANIVNFNLPIKYSRYTLNNYLLFGLKKEFDLSAIDYTNDSKPNDALLVSSSDSLYLDTDLLKSYSNLTHTLNFNLTFTKENIHKTKGDIFGINSNDQTISIFPYYKKDDSVNLMLNQSLFGNDSKEQYISHKLSQTVTFDKNQTSNLENLENQFLLKLPYSTFSNKVLYNHDDKIFVSSQVALNIKKDQHYLNVDYSYSIDKNETTDSYKNGEKHKSIVASIGTKVLKYYTISYKEQYDLIDHISTIKEYGFSMDRKCWGLDVVLADSLVASASDRGKAIRQNIIYVTYTLKPITSLKQTYIQNEREE